MKTLIKIIFLPVTIPVSILFWIVRTLGKIMLGIIIGVATAAAIIGIFYLGSMLIAFLSIPGVLIGIAWAFVHIMEKQEPVKVEIVEKT